MTTIYDVGGITLRQGEALRELAALPSGSVHAVIADPPYCSGGGAIVQADPVVKYAHNNNACGRPSFFGDAKDQRSFYAWCVSWMVECRRVLVADGYFLVFIDWRMLPVMTDAVQGADLIWRGIGVWDKGAASRAPHIGFFRHQCEYFVWATNGACRPRSSAGPFDGCVFAPTLQSDKHHLTGKPTALLRQLVQCVAPGEVILDPFAGSATTLVAAQQTGRRAIGIEREAAYCRIGAQRLGGKVSRKSLAEKSRGKVSRKSLAEKSRGELKLAA